MRRRTLMLAAACGLLLLSPSAPLGAGEDAPAPRRATDAVRAALPEPTPAIAMDYAGDLMIDGVWAGEVRFTVRAAKVGRQVVWRVGEEWFQDVGGAEIETKVTLHLGRDLAISSGTAALRSKERSVDAVISRTESGFLVLEQARQGDAAAGAPDELAVKAPPGASGGVSALLLFLRTAPAKEEARFALPWLASADWLAARTLRTVGDMEVVVQGPSKDEGPRGERPTWAVECTSTSGRFLVHMTPDRRGLVAIRGTVADHAFAVVPRGEAGGRDLDADPDKPAATWKEAFLQFGFGYHMARPDLLAAAFHWDAMYAHETEVLGRWSKDRPLAEFKQAWIDEFIANSKHRSRPGTVRLLAMTLASGTVKAQGDRVTFAAHANFGGGVQRTYHLERRDGVWGIVRIDF